MSKAATSTDMDDAQRTRNSFTIKSKGRIFLGRRTLNELGIHGSIGTGELRGTSVELHMHEADRFFGMGVAGRYMEFPTELQRDGEVTIPEPARDYFDLEEGDEVWLTVRVP